MFMCLHDTGLQSMCVQELSPEARAPTVSQRVWLESFKKGNVTFLSNINIHMLSR